MNASLPVVPLVLLAFLGSCASPSADTPSSTCECATSDPPPEDPDDQALPPLMERKIETLRRLKERAVIRKGPHVDEFAPRFRDTHQVFFGNLHSHTS